MYASIVKERLHVSRQAALLLYYTVNIGLTCAGNTNVAF